VDKFVVDRKGRKMHLVFWTPFCWDFFGKEFGSFFNLVQPFKKQLANRSWNRKWMAGCWGEKWKAFRHFFQRRELGQNGTHCLPVKLTAVLCQQMNKDTKQQVCCKDDRSKVKRTRSKCSSTLIFHNGIFAEKGRYFGVKVANETEKWSLSLH